jgi:hypothetical protein
MPKGPPAVTTVPGLEVHARNEQIHAERKQKGDAAVEDMRRLTMQGNAEKGFELYVRPKFQLSAKVRLAAWQLLLGERRPPPGPEPGAFEVSLKSKEFAFEFCYGVKGHILDQTLKHGVDRMVNIWFEDGTNGPFTKLVVGLYQSPKGVGGTAALAMTEAWYNISVWIASGSRQQMHNAVAARRKAVNRSGLIQRVEDFLAGAFPMPIATAAVNAPRTHTAEGFAYSQQVINGDSRESKRASERKRLREELEGRMGQNRTPAEITQLINSWFHSARATCMLRQEIAELARDVWCSYGTPDSPERAEHCHAAEAWLDQTFPAEGDYDSD